MFGKFTVCVCVLTLVTDTGQIWKGSCGDTISSFIPILNECLRKSAWSCNTHMQTHVWSVQFCLMLLCISCHSFISSPSTWPLTAPRCLFHCVFQVLVFTCCSLHVGYIQYTVHLVSQALPVSLCINDSFPWLCLSCCLSMHLAISHLTDTYPEQLTKHATEATMIIKSIRIYSLDN